MYKLPDLPYAFDALEPFIDEVTMKLHHGAHHAGYVEKLNKALEGRDNLLALSIEELLQRIEDVPEEIRQSVINNGGGHANHSMFWSVMGPKKGGGPNGNLADTIGSTFGGFDEFKKIFTEKALSLFGSGWVFLEVTASGLNIKRHSFQNSPLMNGNVPILALDVWEHAYYLKYQNRRAEYVEAWWNVVNWEKVDENFGKTLR